MLWSRSVPRCGSVALGARSCSRWQRWLGAVSPAAVGAGPELSGRAKLSDRPLAAGSRAGSLFGKESELFVTPCRWHCLPAALVVTGKRQYWGSASGRLEGQSAGRFGAVPPTVRGPTQPAVTSHGALSQACYPLKTLGDVLT